MSGTRALAVDPLSPAGCEVCPPWIGLVLAHPLSDRIGIQAIWMPNVHIKGVLMSPQQFF